jgi:hypothetical protein
MAFIPCALSCAAELRFTSWTCNIEITLSFKHPTEVTAANLLVLCDLLSDWWYATLRLQQRNNIIMREVYARSLEDESGPTATSYKRAGQLGGVATGSPMPGNVALAVTFRTAMRGRSYRGRNYVPGLHTGALVSTDYNSVTTTYANNVVAAYNALLPGGSYDPTPYVWVVVSRFHDHQPRLAGVATPITSVGIGNVFVDSMRRRLTGRGT